MSKLRQEEQSIWHKRIVWGWSSLPSRRRHLYVYTLLVLFALFVRVAESYKELAKAAREREKAARMAKMMIFVPAQ